nr:MAG TPA: hypothetical protein [Caudoviricetes sp.]DAW74255.1 MAG TPA: hypothetical protein [Caudoviricetes sp.]
MYFFITFYNSQISLKYRYIQHYILKITLFYHLLSLFI